MSLEEIDRIVDDIGGSIKENSLRQEYENAEKYLSNLETKLRTGNTLFC
ncbi:hypothetical protein [Lachnotalea glycerini]|nr:hypothetical protein [Lachnotalea glycerini]